MSGKKGQNPKLFKNKKNVLCKCDNFVPIVVPGLSSEAHRTSSAEDSAENTKESTLDHPETTKASRHRLQDLPEWLQEFTDNLLLPRSIPFGRDSKDPPEPPRLETLPSKALQEKHNV